MELIKRTLEAQVTRLMTLFPVITITGPRQSGKTTLAKTIAKDYQYISFENPDIRENAKKDPRGFLRQYPNKAIFDEIQLVPELVSYLQEIIDLENEPGMYILTGSQNLALHEQVSQSLAGRTAMLRLLPFEIAELNDQPAQKEWDFPQWIVNGFYPRLYYQKIPPSDFYPAYFETYIQRDVRHIQNIHNLSGFITFIRLCAGRIGQLLELTSLANDAGVSVNTAKGWLSVLEASYIIFLLQPYYKNLNQRVIKSPKLYFYDTGLASWLLKISDPDQLESHYLRGGLFENMIIADLLKQSCHRLQQADLYFLRNSNGVEIDCVSESPNGLELIEIKSGRTFNQGFLSGLTKWSRNIPDPSVKKSLVYAGNEETWQSGIQVRNWKKYL
ncbi:MAG: ATP-binding protein [Bacteroidia bacterium]|nr:ATP-binding protein [Bacteroidia bacterium]